MTVCIAAIYMGQSVVGASDRLLTAADMQFQPDTSKIRTLTNSIVAMTAGDAWLQSEILTGVSVDIANAIETDPDHWVDVRYVVDSYCHHWAEIRRRRAEQQILAPLGVTTQQFLSGHAIADPTVAQNVADTLLSYGLPSVACLITGVDTSGPHIFVIHDGSLFQADTIGFAAIGSGARHAESQLMLAHYAPNVTVAAALALIHRAKTRAEVAPGVGSATDMFAIGPGLGTFMNIPPLVMDYLGSQAQKLKNEEAEALQQAQEGMSNFIESWGTQTAEPQEIEPDLARDQPDTEAT